MFSLIRSWFGGSSQTVDTAETSLDSALKEFAEGVREDLVEARANFRANLGLDQQAMPKAIDGKKKSSKT